MAPVQTLTRHARRSTGSAELTQPPLAAGGLLGRGEQIARVARALELSQLVTLTGPPGIGKTRLALAVAVAAGRRARSATVELASVADPALVPAAVASSLGVSEAPGQSPIVAIVATLRRRQLSVLENCEHLLSACAQVVGELLAACPEGQVLATSREPLALEGERV